MIISKTLSWLYVGESNYSKAGIQFNFRSAMVYFQGTYLLAVEQSGATLRDRFGIEASIGFRF